MVSEHCLHIFGQYRFAHNLQYQLTAACSDQHRRFLCLISCVTFGRVLKVPAVAHAGTCLISWLEENGAEQQKLELQEVTIDGMTIDISVTKEDVDEGTTVLRIPDKLVVTLDQVFENETVAELLTTDKLSELACLALYLMCEVYTALQCCPLTDTAPPPSCKRISGP